MEEPRSPDNSSDQKKKRVIKQEAKVDAKSEGQTKLEFKK